MVLGEQRVAAEEVVTCTQCQKAAALRNSSACRSCWQEWWSERAAIREYEGGMPRVDAERDAKAEAVAELGGEL